MEHIRDVIKRLPMNITAEASGSDLSSESRYECELCHDARFVHPRRQDGVVDLYQVVPCSCVKESLAQEKANRMMRLCELPSGCESMTFDLFQVLPGLEQAYALAVKFASEESEKNWLTFVCGGDRGKTHLLVAICRQWLLRGKAARYAYVPLLLAELRRGFRHEGDYSYENRFDFFLNVPLLALDDLGTEHATPWVQEKLDTIIDYRLMHGLALVVTTNLPIDEITFRVQSRIRRHGEIIYIDAPEFSTRGRKDTKR